MIIGVEHDDDVGLGLEGGVVARLLIATVPEVGLMLNDLEPQRPRPMGGRIRTRIVDQDDMPAEKLRQVDSAR